MQTFNVGNRIEITRGGEKGDHGTIVRVFEPSGSYPKGSFEIKLDGCAGPYFPRWYGPGSLKHEEPQPTIVNRL